MLQHFTFIAGVKFRPGANVHLDSLEEGTDLTLVPEPTNKYDRHAIKVMSGDMFVGYVPKDLAEDVGKTIAAGKLVSVHKNVGHKIFINYEGEDTPDAA